MNYFRNTLILALLAGAILVQQADAKISRVAKRMGFIELHGSYANPIGTINGFPIDGGEFFDQGRHVESDAKDTYGGTGSFGLRFGAMRGGITQFSLGLRYTKFAYVDKPEWSLTPEYDFSSFDFDMDFNVRMLNFRTSNFSPFIGIGTGAGLIRAHAKGLNSEYTISFVMMANFGVEMKLWENPDAALSLASVNSYQFIATNDRPRYFTIGAALRYYVSP